MLEQYDDIKNDVQELIDIIKRSSDRINDLVSYLKDYTKTDTKELQPENIDINEIVGSSTKLINALIKQKCNNFKVDLAENLPPVSGIRQRLEQVLVNLLSNACDSLCHPDQSIAVKSYYSDSDNMVCVEVNDTGCGIPGDILKRITDPFFTTRHDEGGTGLGLSISDKIIENANGKLCFSSMPGEGTTAFIKLPPARRKETRNE
jgi:signal transduction histidine kinase